MIKRECYDNMLRLLIKVCKTGSHLRRSEKYKKIIVIWDKLRNNYVIMAVICGAIQYTLNNII